MRSADGTSTCSHSMSLRTQSMLRTAHLPWCLSLGRMAVQPWCPIGLVVDFPSISKTFGSLTIKAAYSFKLTSFIMLCCTLRCFCTFSCKNLIDLDISRWIKDPTLAARRFVWSAAHRTLWTVRLAFAVTVAWLSAPAAHLRFGTRKRHVAKPQTLEALHRSAPGLKYPGES